jgi:hypothetical protein
METPEQKPGILRRIGRAVFELSVKEYSPVPRRWVTVYLCGREAVKLIVDGYKWTTIPHDRGALLLWDQGEQVGSFRAKDVIGFVVHREEVLYPSSEQE